MKIIKNDNTYTVFSGDSVEVYDLLPVGTYVVQFHPMRGFYLEKTTDLSPSEGKLYGNSPQRVETVFSAFGDMTRSLGVLLSGGKGHGKTLLLRLLAQRAQAINLPVILVNQAYSGIGEFINSIHQEIMVAFDEFEKIFAMSNEDDDKGSGNQSQTNLLSLFDGLATSKKLLVATANDMFRLSSFFLNRPGRFHYHFRFSSPSSDEIKEYLTDNMTQRVNEIPKLVDFLNGIVGSYDILRAMVFEMNRRTDPIPQLLGDLNIMSNENPEFKITSYFRDTKKKTSFVRDVRHGVQLWKEGIINVTFDFRTSLDYDDSWIQLEVDLSKRIPSDDGSFEVPGSAVVFNQKMESLKVEKLVFQRFEESWNFSSNAF